MSDTIISSDLQACDDLLCSGESRDDFIEANIDRLSIWKDSAEAGDARGQLLYGLCFFYGHGVEEDEGVAIEWFQKSADQGNAQAQCTLGMCYNNGWGVEENESIANKWFKKSAAQGNSEAIENLPRLAKVELGLEPHKVLTKEISEQFMAEEDEDYVMAEDEDYVDLKEFTAIEDDAAESLGKHQGNLDLESLISLSDSAAESLSKHQGDLSLNALTSLSDGAAESLSKHEGGLYLSGLEALSTAAASNLGNHQGVLDLSGLSTLCDVSSDILNNINRISPVSLFENFTDEMEALYREAKNKSEDAVSEACFYIHDPKYDRTSHESFFEFWEALSSCLSFPLWLMADSEDQSWNFFKGNHRQVTQCLENIVNE